MRCARTQRVVAACLFLASKTEEVNAACCLTLRTHHQTRCYRFISCESFISWVIMPLYASSNTPCGPPHSANTALQAQVRTLDLLNTVQALSASGSCYAERVGAAFPALSSATLSRSDAKPLGSTPMPAPHAGTAHSDVVQQRDTGAAGDTIAQAEGHRANGAANGADPPVYVGDAYYAAKDLLIRVRTNPSDASWRHPNQPAQEGRV